MKIERLSENQIRCTLYKADLADKELLLTELAYGTDKAKELFRELMQILVFHVEHVQVLAQQVQFQRSNPHQDKRSLLCKLLFLCFAMHYELIT